MNTALRIPAFVLLLAATAWADPVQVTGGHEKENIRDAASLMEHWFDEPDVAKEIRAQLAAGDYYCDEELFENGSTDSNMWTTWTTLQGWFCKSKCGGAIVPGDPFLPDDKGSFRRLVELARLLYHERVHMRQSTITLGRGNAVKEPPAWEATIDAMAGWVDAMESNLTALHRRDICLVQRHVRRMIVLIQETISTIDEYLGKPYVQNAASYRALKATLQQRLNNTHFRLIQVYLNGGNLCAEARGAFESCAVWLDPTFDMDLYEEAQARQRSAVVQPR